MTGVSSSPTCWVEAVGGRVWALRGEESEGVAPEFCCMALLRGELLLGMGEWAGDMPLGSEKTRALTLPDSIKSRREGGREGGREGEGGIKEVRCGLTPPISPL